MPPSPASSPSPGQGHFSGQAIVPYLTKLAHGSAPFITAFLLVHLTAPALASLGGSSLASQTMILGREYYQTSLGEKYLVLGPLAVHSLSGLAKRVVSPPGKSPRPFSSLLSLTGYATVLFFLPVHFLTHRVHPTTDIAPIFAVGPAELDYEFVKLGLQTWPWRSWALYAGLVGCVALHAVDGANLIWNTWLKDVFGWWKKGRSRTLAISIGGVVLPVLSGVFALSREPLMMFSATAKRFEAAYTQLFIYKL